MTSGWWLVVSSSRWKGTAGTLSIRRWGWRSALRLGLVLAAMWLGGQPDAGARQLPAAPVSPAARALREVFDFVLGRWELEPASAAGLKGRFSFEMDVGGWAVLHRIEVMGAPTPGATGRANELLLVVFADSGQLRSLYLDNDGKVVRFDVGYAHDSGTLTFLSELVAGQPRQRLTYRPLARDRIEVTSEASNADGRGPLVVTSRSTWRRVSGG